MQLTLDTGQATLLRSILEQHLGDLRMEIGKTENYDLRNSLKRDEVTLNHIIDGLRTSTTAH
jgi:hypothetical protein